MYYLEQTFVVELILYCFIIYTICLIVYIQYSVTKEETIPLRLLTTVSWCISHTILTLYHLKRIYCRQQTVSFFILIT